MNQMVMGLAVATRSLKKLAKLVVLDPYYLFLALLALEELSSSIFSPDVAYNRKFEIKTKLQALL